MTRRVISRATAGHGPDCPGDGGGDGGPSAPDTGAAAIAAAGLTEREAEVLRRCSPAGSANAEIARELFVGEATVKTHVSNVLQKTASATGSRPSSGPSSAGASAS